MQKQAQPAENKMGVMPVNRLLLSMSVPIMISMLVQALYNVVDTIFVSRLGEEAVAALTTAFSIQNLMIAIASGTGVGINAMLSRSLGEKNPEQAGNAARNGIFLGALSALVFLVFGLFFTRPFLSLQTGNPLIEQYGVEYLSICCIASFGLFGQVIFERLLQSTGKTFYTMITQGTGAIINIILDPILIFGLLGFPRMGVAGAAIATVAGQIVAMVLALIFNIKVNHEININMKRFRPAAAAIKRIYLVGVPSIIMLSITSVMSFSMVKILGSFSDTAVSVFGVYFRLQSFIFMPILGLNSGLIPIISYNYGAQKKDRMLKAFKLSIVYAVGIMLVGLVVFQLFPQQLLRMFEATDNMMSIGVAALRTISLSFLLAGFCIICSSLFQALGNGFLSMGVSIARQLLVLIPAAYLLAGTGNLNLVWFAFPIAELMSLLVSCFCLRYIHKKVISKIPSGETLVGTNGAQSITPA